MGKFKKFKPAIEYQLLSTWTEGTSSHQVYVLFLMNNPGFLEATLFPIENYSEISTWKPDFYTKIKGKYFLICSGLTDLRQGVDYNLYLANSRKLLGNNLNMDVENVDFQDIVAPLIHRKAIKLIINDEVIITDTIDVWGLPPIAVDSSFIPN